MPRTRPILKLFTLAFFCTLYLLCSDGTPALSDTANPQKKEFLTGKLLVAQPDMKDPRFQETVIFIARHDETGAFGLIVNRPLGDIEYATVVKNLGADSTGVEGQVEIFYGGPVDPKRGFILHSNDYPHPPLIPVNEKYSITISADIILALANGFGPKNSILAIGYAGWSEGQLERELERKDWVIAPSDESILFDRKFETKWKRAFDRRYIDI